MTRKRDTLSDPVPDGFTYMGWSFSGIVSCPDAYSGSSLPAFTRVPMREARFISGGGEKMGYLLPDDGRPFTIRDAREAVFRHEWRQQETRLASEYARMC